MSSQCIAIYCIYGNISWRYCYLKCDSHPLVARTATSLWELPHGLPHKAHTHTQSPFRWQYVFYFLYFKGLLFTNKINKKKRSKRFFDKHCLSAYCCKKVYIYLSFSSASSNQPTVPFPPSRGFTWMSWTMTMWAGLQRTEQLVIIAVTVAPPSFVSTTNVIGKHMKTVVTTTK